MDVSGPGRPASRRPWRVGQVHDREVEWFRSFGTPDEPGPRLASVSGAVAAPGVVGTEAGVSVVDLVSAAGGPTSGVTGVGIGGLSGGWLTAEQAARATWSRAGLRAYGLSPGPGTVHVLSEDECPIGHVAGVLQHAAGESAGQCGPCMFGVPAVATDVALLAGRRLDPVGWQRLQARLACCPGEAPAGSRTGWRGMRVLPCKPSTPRWMRTCGDPAPPTRSGGAVMPSPSEAPTA